MTKQERVLYLRNHPAVAVRIFDLTQQAIWAHVLMGSNQPLGKITDYWRRIEVVNNICSFVYFKLCHYFIILLFYFKIVSNAGYSSHALYDMRKKR